MPSLLLVAASTASAVPVLTSDGVYAGLPTTLVVEGAAPGRQVVFLASLQGLGAGPCPPQLGGDCIDLLAPLQTLGNATADRSGRAELRVPVPPGAALGSHVWLQAAVAGAPAELTGTLDELVRAADADGDGFDGREDCDDADPAVHPGALEILGAAVDHDCDGVAGLSTWGFAGEAGAFSWEDPTNPELVRLDDEYLLFASGSAVNLTGQPMTDPGVTLRFPLAGAVGGEPPQAPYTSGTWKSSGQILEAGTRLDVATSPAATEAYVLLPARGSTDYAYLYLGAVRLDRFTGSLVVRNTYDSISGLVPAEYTSLPGGVDLTVDALGTPFAASCATVNASGAPAQVLHGIWTDRFPASGTETSIGGDACFFTGPPVLSAGVTSATLRTCRAGATCEDVAFQSPSRFVAQGPTNERWLYGDADEGSIALLDGSRHAFVRDDSGANPDVRVLDSAALPTPVVKDPTGTSSTIDVARSGASLFVAAILDDDSVWLQYGDPASPSVLDLGFVAPAGAGVPTGVAVHADADRVAVAVSSTDPATGQGSVGWMFLSPP